MFVLFLVSSVAFLLADAAMHGGVSVVQLAQVAMYAGLGWMLGGHIDRMRAYAQKDALTDTFNRRYVVKHFARWVDRCRRRHKPLAVLLVDVDDFKPINDTYGHKQGDVVLQTIAQTLVRLTQPDGVVARWGGDEFLVILPDADNPAAWINRLENELEKTTHHAGIAVTVSAGAAVCPVQAVSLDELVKCADVNMYERKRAKKREPAQTYIVNR